MSSNDRSVEEIRASLAETKQRMFRDLDVLDSQNELSVSRTNTINAEFLEIFSVFRLLALKGQLLPALGVAYPQESQLIEVNNKPAEK